MLNRWLLLRFDVLGGLAVFITSCLALAKGLNGGMGGVAILSAQSYVQAIYWTCRYVASSRHVKPLLRSLSVRHFFLEDTGLSWRCVHKSSVLEMAAVLTFPSPASQMDLNSVERAQQYLELPQEPPAIVESNRPPAYWPSSNSENLVRLISSSRGFSR